jgi:CelD/BcsL family acetyltransferase involved in cellulose biosynthesis
MEFTHYKTFPTDLKEEWNQLLAKSANDVPFLRFEYLADWWQTRGGGEWLQEAELAILAAHEGSDLVGIAPFFITEQDGQKKLLLLGCIEISDFLDLIVSEDRSRAFINGLLTFFSDNLLPQGIQSIDLYNLLENSPTVQQLSEAGKSAGFEVAKSVLQQAPFITLPGDWDLYLESIDKKQRHEIRRKMRRAAAADANIEVYFTSDQSKVEEDTQAFLSLMAQDPEKAAFLTPAMREQFKISIQRAFENDWLQLAFLQVDGENAAAYLNMDYQNRIWVYNSGLDRRFMEYSPGWVLLGHLLMWANENKRSAFDFLRGNEDYKYKFGAVDRFVCRVTLIKA